MYILVYTPPRSPMAPIVLYLPSIFLAFGVWRACVFNRGVMARGVSVFSVRGSVAIDVLGIISGVYLRKVDLC